MANPKPPAPPENSFPDQWLLSVNGKQVGPMRFDELTDRIKRGEGRSEDGSPATVWHDGLGDWFEITRVAELRPFVPPPAPKKSPASISDAIAMTAETSAPASRSSTPPKSSEQNAQETAEALKARQKKREKRAIEHAKRKSEVESLQRVNSEIQSRTTPPTAPVQPLKSSAKLGFFMGILVAAAICALTLVVLIVFLNREKSPATEADTQAAEKASGPIEPSEPSDKTQRLTDEVIAFHQRHERELKNCYTAALKRNPRVRSYLFEATLHIGQNGAIQRVTYAKNPDPVVASCLSRTIKQWAFSAPGKATRIVIPIHFGSGK